MMYYVLYDVLRLIHKVTQVLPLRCICTDAGIELESFYRCVTLCRSLVQADASVSSELKKHVLNSLMHCNK